MAWLGSPVGALGGPAIQYREGMGSGRGSVVEQDPSSYRCLGRPSLSRSQEGTYPGEGFGAAVDLEAGVGVLQVLAHGCLG